MSYDEEFLTGIDYIKSALLEHLTAAGILPDAISVLPADYEELPHEVIFNVYANARARSMMVTQTKVIDAAGGVRDIELRREIADLVRQIV